MRVIADWYIQCEGCGFKVRATSDTFDIPPHIARWQRVADEAECIRINRAAVCERGPEIDVLNAALAAKLAPLIGERAVYNEFITAWCPVHGEIGGGGPVGRIRVEDACFCGEPLRDRVEKRKPVDFTDPAVLLPIVEALAKHRTLGLKITPISPQWGELCWLVRVRWQFDEYTAEGDALGPVMAEALLAALTGGTANT